MCVCRLVQEWAENGITDFSYPDDTPTVYAYNTPDCTGKSTTGVPDTNGNTDPGAPGFRAPFFYQPDSCSQPDSGEVDPFLYPIYTLEYAFGDNTIQSLRSCSTGEKSKHMKYFV